MSLSPAPSLASLWPEPRRSLRSAGSTPLSTFVAKRTSSYPLLGAAAVASGTTLHCEQPWTTEPDLWEAMNGSIEFDDIMRDLLT
eukprot:SM007925S22548  [mRNA]  locus=s7925:68:553:- [translate_table: standard]